MDYGACVEVERRSVCDTPSCERWREGGKEKAVAAVKAHTAIRRPAGSRMETVRHHTQLRRDHSQVRQECSR